MKPTLTFVGGGMGDAALLTGKALKVIRRAERIYAPPRLCDAFREVNPKITPALPGALEEALLGDTHRDAVVVVSGDVGFFSLSDTISSQVQETYQIQRLGGLSSLQYFCGLLGLSYQETKVISLHGRTEAWSRVAGAVTFHPRVFFLLGQGDGKALAELLARLEIPGLLISVGERLSAPNERIARGTPRELLGQDFEALSVALVENGTPTDCTRRLRDEDFQRDKVPMTKEAVRCVCAAKLEVRPTDVVWDVGAGTGAMTAQLAQHAREGLVCAVEREPAACVLLAENRKRLGLWNIEITPEAAPGALGELPAPDAVFVGGSGGQLEPALRLALEKNPSVRVCVNAVTLETLAQGTALLESLGFADTAVECVQATLAREVGGYHLMTAQNPVYILTGRGRP